MYEQWCHSQYQFRTNAITQPNHVTTVGLASLDHSSLVWVICHDCGEQFAEISWPIGQPEIFVAKKGKQNSNISYLQHEVIFRLLWQLQSCTCTCSSKKQQPASSVYQVFRWVDARAVFTKYKHHHFRHLEGRKNLLQSMKLVTCCHGYRGCHHLLQWYQSNSQIKRRVARNIMAIQWNGYSHTTIQLYTSIFCWIGVTMVTDDACNTIFLVWGPSHTSPDKTKSSKKVS